MKTLTLLGSTGSIGTQTLDIVKHNPKEFKVKAISAFGDIEKVQEQISEFKVEAACLVDENKADELKKKTKGKVHVYSGLKGLNEIAKYDSSNFVVNSVVGNVGLIPTLEAIKAGKDIGLANKETLVSGGQLVMEAAKKKKVKILPIDSEHSALFQCLNGEKMSEVNKLIITCSGGPFRGKKLNELTGVTAEQALNHPTWKMGGKITIDSATLMNKGFEVGEAMWLYNIPVEQIQVVIHPQSIIHSMVEFVDGNIMAQIGTHDMRMPIQYALTWPERLPSHAPKLDWTQLKEFTFDVPDPDTFKCLAFGYEAAKTKGTLSCVLNAVNDVSVFAFLDGKIEFLDIQNTIETVMKKHKVIKNPVLDDVIQADNWARKEAQKELELEEINAKAIALQKA